MYSRTLYDLWNEYVIGIGGRKPAREFTATDRGKLKYKYYRRKTEGLSLCIHKRRIDPSSCNRPIVPSICAAELSYKYHLCHRAQCAKQSYTTIITNLIFIYLTNYLYLHFAEGISTSLKVLRACLITEFADGCVATKSYLWYQVKNTVSLNYF